MSSSPCRALSQVRAGQARAHQRYSVTRRHIELDQRNALPAWVNSDHLTALSRAGAAGGAYWYASVNPYGLLLVIPLLVINWFGDSLDGTLARVHRQRPRYGFYVDHLWTPPALL